MGTPIKTILMVVLGVIFLALLLVMLFTLNKEGINVVEQVMEKIREEIREVLKFGVLR